MDRFSLLEIDGVEKKTLNSNVERQDATNAAKAAQIVDSQNKVAFAYSGNIPWHKAGQVIPEGASFNEALQLAGVDFTVRAEPCQGVSGAKFFEQESGPHVIIREDTNECIGVASNKYPKSSVRQKLTPIEAMVDELGYSVDTIGALENGAKIFGMIKLDNMEIGDGDIIRRDIGFVDSFDSTWSWRLFPSAHRMVCANTCAHAIQHEKITKQGISIRHSKNLQLYIDQVKEMVTDIESNLNALKETWMTWKQTKITSKDVSNFVNKFYKEKTTKTGSTRVTNQREKFFETYLTAPGQDIAGETAWGLYNAATYTIDWERSLRGEVNVGGRWYASQFGSGQALRENAAQLVVQLVASK